MEYIRGPRSAIYGSGAMGGVINVITHSDKEESKVTAGVGSEGYQQYDGTLRHRFGDTVATVAGSYEGNKGFNVQPDSSWSHDQDRDGFRSKAFWGGLEHKFNDNLNGFFRGRSYTNNSDYDLGSPPYSPAYSADEEQLYNQSWDAGLAFSSGIYSSQLIASYQKVKDYNYSSIYGRYNDGTTLDRMTQRNLQWGNNVIVGHGSVSAGVDWQQQRLTSSDTVISDTYKRDNTGLYLTGQQRLAMMTLEACRSRRS